VSPDAAPPDTDEDTSSSDGSPAVEPASPPTRHPAHLPTQVAPEEASGEDAPLTLEGFVLDEATLVNSPTLPYLATVASVLEGRTIGLEELRHVLRQTMRQRSFDRLPRRDDALCFLNQHPP
jgi:hypothetical protein